MGGELTITGKLRLAEEYDRLAEDAAQTSREWEPEARARFVADSKALAAYWRRCAGVTEVSALDYPVQP